MYQQAPMAPAQPSVLVTMFKSLDLGAKIAGIAGLVAAISFFLPWTKAAYGVLAKNGMDMTKDSAVFWLILLLPLVATGLLYFAYNNDLRTKIIVAAAQISIGTFVVFDFLRGGVSGGEIGAYGAQLGFIAIAVGGFISIFELTKRLAGVR
jgi:hypothetical protein